MWWGGGVCSILLLTLVARCLETIDVCIWHMFVFMSVLVIVWECLLCSGRGECLSMLYVCVRGVMAVVFSVCIVTRGAVGARVWEI